MMKDVDELWKLTRRHRSYPVEVYTLEGSVGGGRRALMADGSLWDVTSDEPRALSSGYRPARFVGA